MSTGGGTAVTQAPASAGAPAQTPAPAGMPDLAPGLERAFACRPAERLGAACRVDGRIPGYVRGTYYLNDARDVDADRRHPTKCNRPVAAGVVPVPTAYAVGFGLLAASVALSFTARWELAVTVAGYGALTTAYSLWLKRIAVIDVAAVAGGFVLRAIAGAAATHVPISDWFFIVTTFGSLFMVSGKRVRGTTVSCR